MATDNATSRILIVDDDRDQLALIERWLANAGFDVVTAHSSEAALGLLESEQADLVITDLIMDGIDGIQLQRELHRIDPILPVIIISGHAKIDDAVTATHDGATAFLTKPLKRDKLIELVEDTLFGRARPYGSSIESFAPKLVYRSRAMAELARRAQRVAMVDTSVLITGETGTGKEVLAEAIHNASPRASKPFIAVNCGALPSELLESELFGHERGAFTGAVARHQGLFRAANGGTLFLDEIGDMPLSLQPRLLRVLQDYKVRSVGAVESVSIDVRVVSATNCSLEELVQDGRFRADLYHRLRVIPLRIPSLSERREDIPVLVEYFLQSVAERTGERPKRFAPDAMRNLIAADYPGNVRQLKNLVEQCAILSPSAIIPLTLALEALGGQAAPMPRLNEAKQAFERRYLASLLRIAGGNITEAARLAGRNRTEFYRLLARHNLDPALYREGEGESIKDAGT